jgi:hypothetical protein
LDVNPAVSTLVREAYVALLNLENDPSSAGAKRALDQVREQFENATGIFERAMIDYETEAR